MYKCICSSYDTMVCSRMANVIVRKSTDIKQPEIQGDDHNNKRINVLDSEERSKD